LNNFFLYDTYKDIKIKKIYCYCKGCRFADSHITSYHKCGICKGYGHGQFECAQIKQNNNYQNALFDNYILTNKEYLPKEKYCTNPNCKSKSTHSIESHHKFFESDKHGGLLGPDIHGITKQFVDTRKEGMELVLANPNSFVKYWMGLGQIDIYRNINGVIEYKYVDASCDYKNKIKLFTNGLKELNKKW
jgi:hypothetical protein